MTPKQPWGPWTVYRRRSDAGLWVDFHLICDRLNIPVSKALAEMAKEYVKSHSQWLPPDRRK